MISFDHQLRACFDPLPLAWPPTELRRAAVFCPVLEVDGRRRTQPLVITGDPEYPDVVGRYETFGFQQEEVEEDGDL